jgi:hypothetical protein
VYLAVLLVLAVAATAGGGAAALVLASMSLVVGGVVGSYFSTYWTLAFRRMEVDAPQPMAWPPPQPV